MTGFHNRILHVDLGSGKQTVIKVDEDHRQNFIGGSALAARLFSDTDATTADSLSPQNPLILMTGPMVGTGFPGSSRFVICARSPLTGIWGESASGGFFGAELKKAGFDGIIIAGRAHRPCYLLVENAEASLLGAEDLWGSDTYATVEALKKRHQGRGPARILTIGPAGEKMVKFASVCNDKAHYFGRTGMGAVMGSKNLKALVVRGTGRVPLADPAAYRAARKAALQTIKESMIAASMHDLGTAAAMDMGMMTGDVPIKNWTIGEDYTMSDALGGPAIHETILKGRAACSACPIGCKPVVEVNHSKYGIAKGPGPEYESCAAFGTLIMNADLEAVAYLNECCNRLGLDTITCGATVAFVMECFEKGLLGRDDLDGLELTWSSVDAVVEMVNRIAARQGFGDRAAEGSRALAAQIGGSAGDYAVTVKGLEVPMHDPRAFHGLGLAYMTSNRGACHLQHTVQAVEQGMVAWPEIGLEEDYPATASRGKAKMVIICEDIGQMANTVCICHFVYWAMGPNCFLDGFNSVTGLGFDMQTFMKVGQRAWVLKRALNNIMGVAAEGDRLPKKILTALVDGAAAGSVPDEDLLRRDYYELRGLDEKGIPAPQLLDSLSLEFIKERLEKARGARTSKSSAES